MVSVIFTSGDMLEAPTWRELERKLREDEPWNAVFTKPEFRGELARRAWVWSETPVEPGTSRHLFRQLERAGLLRIVTDTEVPQ